MGARFLLFFIYWPNARLWRPAAFARADQKQEQSRDEHLWEVVEPRQGN